MRRYGKPPQKGQRHRMRPGAYAILPYRGKVLLTVQTDPEIEVQLPGGGIDPGESPLQALHREVLEETGWRIAQARRLGAFQRFIYMPEYDLWAQKICHIFVARPTRQVTEISEPAHQRLFLDPAEALTVMGNEGDRAFLQTYFG